MNFQQKTTSEPKAGEQPWYHNPATAQTVPLESVTESLQEPRFEPAAAERILARAGALQEVQRQMLSLEQIEAIATEVGIKPEFVHLAIEQQKAGVLSEPYKGVSSGNQKTIRSVTAPARHLMKLRVIATAGGCALITATYAALDYYNVGGPAIVFPLLVFPLLLSFALGTLGRSRRWGAASGLAIATAIMTTLLALWILREVRLISLVFPMFSVAIASCTLAGVAGAQARRVVSKRQSNNRSN